MAETASTLAAWRVGGQIDESALTGISQFADITVVATLIGATGQNVVDPSNEAHVLRGPYTTVVGGTAGTATTHPTADGNATLAGRLWWTEPLKATGAANPNAALQPSGLAWSIAVTTTTRRGDVHPLATFVVNLEGDRDYTALGETVLVPSGAAGADESAVNVTNLVTPPATVADNTFEGRVSAIIAANPLLQGADGVGVPPGGTTGQALVKASNSDFDTGWGTSIAGSGLPAGHINAADYGVDPAIWYTGGDSTAAFQAAFDAAAAMHIDATGGNGGVELWFPRGRYRLLGTVTIPSMLGRGGFIVNMHGCSIRHEPVTEIPMFRTTTPTDANNAEALNDVRNLWTWNGGRFSGTTNSTFGFELNAVSRMVMQRILITDGFDTGIRGRFVLHFKLRDSMIHVCNDYGVQIKASGSSDAWPGASAANAASNGTVIENVRFSGKTGQTGAQLSIYHSGHVVRDCTFEGGAPLTYNYEFVNGNTSVLTSKAENMWMENEPGIALVKVDTPHQFELDFQYLNTDGLVADVHKASMLHVKRVPWGDHENGTQVLYKVNSVDANTVTVRFDHAGANGAVNPSLAGLWSGGVFPRGVAAYTWDPDGWGGTPRVYFSGGGGGPSTQKQIWMFEAPNSGTAGINSAVPGTQLPAVWTLVHDPTP